MEQHYKLTKVRELSDNDQDFINALAQAFIDEVPPDAETLKQAVQAKDYLAAYKAAHKMKPTIDMFELGVYDELIEVQDWGKFEKTELDVTQQLHTVVAAITLATAEIKQDFNL